MHIYNFNEEYYMEIYVPAVEHHHHHHHIKVSQENSELSSNRKNIVLYIIRSFIHCTLAW